jgi:hypothetical protein
MISWGLFQEYNVGLPLRNLCHINKLKKEKSA